MDAALKARYGSIKEDYDRATFAEVHTKILARPQSENQAANGRQRRG